jgi:hypothetical protein
MLSGAIFSRDSRDRGSVLAANGVRLDAGFSLSRRSVQKSYFVLSSEMLSSGTSIFRLPFELLKARRAR